MTGRVEETKGTIRPEFNAAIMIDFQGAKIPFVAILPRCCGVRTDKILVDGVTRAEVRSKHDGTCFFTNLTTVLPESGPVRLHTETFSEVT